jgi:tyrosyl-DNA phosphodiesterase 2
VIHLDSRDRFSYRAQQLKQLAGVLREPDCCDGVIVGDFNALTNKDDKLIEENRVEDAWLVLYGDTDTDAPTWSVGRRREAEFEPRRLDKVAMVGLTAETMEIMHPGFIDMPKPGETSDQIEWSDIIN